MVSMFRLLRLFVENTLVWISYDETEQQHARNLQDQGIGPIRLSNLVLQGMR